LEEHAVGCRRHKLWRRCNKEDIITNTTQTPPTRAHRQNGDKKKCQCRYNNNKIKKGDERMESSLLAES
jgi:hypothetical protein